MQHVNFSSAARTHPGLVRDENQDAILARDDLNLWAVADGMGGHHSGLWASATMTETLARLASQAVDRANLLDMAVADSNREIVAASEVTGDRIGTTVAALAFDGAQLTGAWVGDSRIYRYRGGALERMTRDHSVVQDLIDRGTLSSDDAETHPLSNVLSRAVGSKAQVAADHFAIEPVAGDLFLLCSDGLSRFIDDGAIAETMDDDDNEDVVDRLMNAALAAGAPDNVSVVLLRAA